jgi:UPF0716 protein FxsA
VITLLLTLVFLVLPIVELYLFVQASHALGFLNALGLILVISFVGAALVKRQGLRVWSSFNQAIDEGRVPSQEIAHGVCLLVAGALLIAPGFFTDVLGVLLLLPPVRALLLRLLARRSARRKRGTVVRATYSGRIVDASAREARTDDPPRGELEP